MDDQFIKPNLEEQKDIKDSDNEESTSTESNNEESNSPPEATNPVTPSQPKSQKSKKKLWLLILLALLIIGSAAAYWFFFMKEKAQEQSSSDQQSSTLTEQKKGDTKLYFHVGKKLISYDTDVKTEEVLTSSIPDGASILDFYAEGDNWRAYYDLRDGPDYSISYIEKDSTPKEVYKSQEFVMSAASAKSKVVAYTEVYDVSEDATDAKTKSRHYVIKNDETTLLLESEKYDVEKAASDATSSKYTIEDVTSDGKKAMMQLHSCFYCDGPAVATGMEIDLGTKKTTLVYESEKSGIVTYASDDSYIVAKTSEVGMGFSDEPLVEEILGFKKAGDEPTTLLSVSEKDWARLNNTEKMEFISPEIKTQNYVENGLTSFGGIYETKGSSVSDAVKLTVEDLDGSKYAVTNFGKIVNSCVGVAIGDRDDPYGSIGNNKYQVGAVCKEGDKTKFYMVDELSVDSKDSVFEIISAL